MGSTIGFFFVREKLRREWAGVPTPPSLLLKVGGRTYQDYRNILRLHVRPTLGSKKLSAIRPLDIQKLVDDLQKKGLGPRTTRHAHEVLCRALKQG